MPAMHETKIHGSLSFPFTVYGAIHSEYLRGFPLHWHDEMEIIYVKSGAMNVTVQNNDFNLYDGDMIFVQPQVIHSINHKDNLNSEYYNILFRLSLLDSGKADACFQKYIEPVYSQKVMIPSCVKSNSKLHKKLLPFVSQLIELNAGQDDNSELIIKSCIFGIMHFICMNCSPANEEEQYNISLNSKLKKTLEYIRNNYSENITVEKAANLSNFSASHFSKMFRQLTGSSFTQYLKNYRLEMASDKLENNESKVSEIAFECGFNNLSYFTRAFCEKYHKTPSEFRKNKNTKRRIDDE